MADYNIIYTSAENGPFLFNGSNFDALSTGDNEKLMFSGKGYEDKELAPALKKALEAAKKQFPGDPHPVIKQVEITVNSKDDAKGHSQHITS